MKDKMTLDKLAGIIKNRFDEVDLKFVEIDERFNGVDQRFDRIEATMEHNQAELCGRLTSVERRTTILESKC